MNSHEPMPAERSAAYLYMHRKWPTAHSMRWEGKCDNCKKLTLYSAVSHLDEKVAHYPAYKDKGNEPCGYFCVKCGWGNAGSRPVADAGEDGE